MQVNDATAAPGAPVGRKDDPAGGATDAARKAARSGARFRDALRRGSGGAHGAGGAETAMAAALAGWFRAEPAPRPSTPPPVTPAPPAAPSKIDRILIGEMGGDVEARIRIGSGALAGTEIRLTSVSGSRAVSAELLTRAAGSRQTLSVVMDEIRLRLRSKGIALAAPTTRPRGAKDRAARRPNDGDGSKSGGGTGW